MSDHIKIAGIAIIIAAVSLAAIWWEYSLWSECRADHSFFYCVRVLGK